jgi:hypothetical protein
MMSIEYAVGLEGHPFDLEQLRSAFDTGPLQVREIDLPNRGGTTVLRAREFDALPSGVEVQESARRIVAQLNGALFAADADRSVVRMGAIYARSRDGIWGQGTTYGSAAIEVGNDRTRATAVVVGADGVPRPETEQKPRQSSWIALAEADGPDPNSVVDVLHALAGDPDWFDLWRVYELICGDQRALPNWPHDQVKWFTQTATRYRHSPSHRHGRTATQWLEENGKPEMRLSEARRLMSTIAGTWLDWRVSS